MTGRDVTTPGNVVNVNYVDSCMMKNITHKPPVQSELNLDIRWVVFLHANILLRSFSALTSCVNQAWWISQSIHPYVSIKNVFHAGVPEAGIGAENSWLFIRLAHCEIAHRVLQLHGGGSLYFQCY